MKNPHIIPKEDGLYLADLPEELNVKNYPSVLYGERYIKDSEKYQKAVQQAIKDAVKLKDKVLGLKLFYNSVPKGQEQHDHPYKVDLSGYDVRNECTNVPCDGKNCKMVVILTPILPPKKDGSLCGNFPRVSKERIDGYQPNNTVDTLLRWIIGYSSKWLVSRLGDSLQNIIEIGKRDMRNPKYDSYFRDADEALEAYSNYLSIKESVKPSVIEESQEEFGVKLLRWFEHEKDRGLNATEGYDDLVKRVLETRKPKKG